jgi:phenylalanyl-tRNA synthetase alpha chain
VEAKIQALEEQFSHEISDDLTIQGLNDLKVKYLGKKGAVQGLMRYLKEVPPEQRPHVGKCINDIKQKITTICEGKISTLIAAEENKRLGEEHVDMTLPGRKSFLGRQHIISKTLEHVLELLTTMGFSVHYGPDIETDYYNFESLNFAADHPARDMQDTFYITPSHLLRTHTSNVQVRMMEGHKPPLRIASPGKCYRNEAISARSHVFFHQVEAFYIDKGVTFRDLISMLKDFLGKLFYKEIKTRFRPSYFPFVEPGMEVDISCIVCEAKGCPLCKGTGWLEVLGAGMVHPEVLKNGGIDPEEYTGYAWGAGIERIAMLKHGIKDIRLFTENDARFLGQFS